MRQMEYSTRQNSIKCELIGIAFRKNRNNKIPCLEISDAID